MEQVMKLRPYQVDAIAAIRRDWAAGLLDVLLVAATGAGKTNIFLSLLMEALDAAPARALILAHRQELIEQPIQRIGHIDAEWLMRGDGLRPRVGVVMADRDDGDRELVIATVQSLASGKRLERLLRHGPIDILVTDECFPAGTLVDGRPIETIKVGDEVAAFDEANETIVRGRVSRTFRRLPPHTKLRRLTVGERSVVCTMDHPFLTDCGWRCARDLWVGDWVAIQGDVDGTGLHDLRRDVHVNQSAAGCLEPNGTPTRVLSPGMQSGIFGASVVPTDGGDQPQVCVSTHEDQQSHATAGDPAEAKGGVARDWTPAPRSWWEWKAPSRATATAGECVGVDDRGYRPDKGTEVQCGTPPQSLQAGYRRQGDEDCDRGGWEVTSRIGATSAGCQENSVAHWARLDGVESIESGRDGSFGGVCPDGHVYNLEVEQFHTYIANGFIVHNCHHATAPSYLKVYQALKEANPALRHLGVTATPMRGDGDGLARVYQADSARITIADLVRQGFLVQPRWLGISTGISIAGVKTSGDDFVQAQLAKVFDTEQGRAIVLAAYQQYARDRRAIAFTASVAGAHELAAAFAGAGIAAAAIDGTTPKDDRRRILDAFRRGDIQVVANCQVLTEGFDAPGTNCILMCRPTRSDSQYVQCMGRGLRPLMGMAQPGEDCLILDFLPAETRNIVMAGDVLGLPKHVVRTVTAERETAPGEVQAGFTFDGEHFDTGGTPLEIIARQLDYLQTSPFHWHRRDGWLVLGLGAGSDQVERILVITPAQDGAVQRLYGLYRRGWMDGDYATWGPWQSGTIAEGDFDTLSETAHEMAAKWGNTALSSKDRAWHQQPISDGQAKFLRRLASRDELGKLERISKGEAAALITHFQARQILRRAGAWS
jgi:superfamily II DNA or RNA helicase